ncbi:alpha/beta fold hydrolase [Actinotalea solisilvae]|uniref:alpha/beta fold hydrolase n=1 Tax=Actinotalea solisilvae TaxID=2072922 RepID=UPI0018F18B26|nr:alpha/beta fold hydrolase [Actinotalea solisilvae]
MDSFTRAGLTFDVVDHAPAGTAGQDAADAPTVVALHGFPQSASVFDAVAGRLTAAGVRVLAPDQRGYSPRARPPGRRPYVVPELVADVVALLDAAGVERAHLVGHDWGGTVAWTFAGRHPDRTLSVTSLTTPHPAAMAAALRRPAQARRSSYMLAFQVPRLPEARLLARGGARLRRSLERAGLAPDDAQRWTTRMLEPGALTAGLAWYRAIPLARGRGAGRTRVPTTFVTGRRDPFVAHDAAERTAGFVLGPYRHVELDADHWLPEHRPDDVAAAVLAHLR